MRKQFGLTSIVPAGADWSTRFELLAPSPVPTYGRLTSCPSTMADHPNSTSTEETAVIALLSND